MYKLIFFSGVLNGSDIFSHSCSLLGSENTPAGDTMFIEKGALIRKTKEGHQFRQYQLSIPVIFSLDSLYSRILYALESSRNPLISSWSLEQRALKC